MDELIEKISAQLGIDPSTAKMAVAKVMGMLRQHGDEETFQKIANAIPGAQAAADSEPASAASTDGGLLGKLAGMASAALGGKAGGGIELGAALASAGITTDQIGPFIKTVVAFLRDKLGDDVVDDLLNKFPMLKSLLG